MYQYVIVKRANMHLVFVAGMTLSIAHFSTCARSMQELIVASSLMLLYPMDRIWGVFYSYAI